MEESTNSIDAGESKSILSEEWTAIGIVIDSATGFEQTHTQGRDDVALQSAASATHNGVKDGVFADKTQAVDDVLDLCRELNKWRLQLEIFCGCNYSRQHDEQEDA